MNTLYWHDYETWGANPPKDKPVQFAGIRTDEALNIIGEPLMCYCKPSNDCLPQPEACLITGISPQYAMEKGRVEVEFFRLIHHELAQAGTCGVGYNSIRFDDEVTRYGLYRNFYDPYEREWKNGNSRWDIIDMVRLVYALRPDHINWPLREDGTPSFKLEALSAANGLVHDAAHDALSDVYATIALAKLIKQQYPALYDYAYALRDKRRASALIDLAQRKPLLHISSRFSSAHGCAALVVPIMQHPTNANSIIAYDLSVHPEPLLSLSAAEVSERIYSKQHDLPEGIERIPLKEIHLNKSPMLVTAKMLDDNIAERLSIDKNACNKHWQLLRAANITATLTEVYSSNPFPPKVDPEQQLYDGFINSRDRQLFPAIRNASPAALAAFASQLSDQRLKVLLFRYRARNYPETLTPEEQLQWEEWRYYRLTDSDAGASITLDHFFARLDELQITPEQEALKISLLDYADSLLA